MLTDSIEVGCDEAGRGSLAGPVFAAAVILPFDFRFGGLNDSKQLSERERIELRKLIEKDALCYAVASCSPEEIDRLNILWASVEAMHKALAKLSLLPEHIIVDGNHFRPYRDIPFTKVIKGDAKYCSIAAASILAKTYRDDYMREIHKQYPQYGWSDNKGYPTEKHRTAIEKYGITRFHRESFRLHQPQLRLNL